MKSLEETLKDQEGTLTHEQAYHFFKCFGRNCTKHNLGTYKCDIGLCDSLKEAIEKYVDSDKVIK